MGLQFPVTLLQMEWPALNSLHFVKERKFIGILWSNLSTNQVRTLVREKKMTKFM